MRKIIKVTSILGIATIVKIASGLIRAKFLAWQLGPAGLGLIGQALMYSSFTIQLCSLNMQFGITKGVSESLSLGRPEKVPLIVNAAQTFQFMAAIIFAVVVLPFTIPLARNVFSDAKFWPYLAGITLVTPFAVYLSGMADPIFYGFKKIAEYTKLMILYTVIGLFLVITLVYFLKTDGMLLQMLTIAVVGFFLSRHFIKKKTSLKPALVRPSFRDVQLREVSSNLFQYGLVSFIPANVNMLVLIYLRGLLMKQYGLDASGFFQVAYGMSSYYLPFVTNGIWGHFYPEMCSIQTKEAINKELGQFIRFVLLASTAIASGCIIFRKYIILAIFSREFMAAYDLLAIQAVGDIFFVLFCVFSTSLMARKNFKAVISISTIGYNAALIGLYLLLRYFGTLGFASLNAAIALTNAAAVAVHIAYANRETGFVLGGRNLSLLVKSAVLISVILFIPDGNPALIIVKMGLFFSWLAVSVTRDEMAGFKGLVTAFFRKKEVNLS